MSEDIDWLRATHLELWKPVNEQVRLSERLYGRRPKVRHPEMKRQLTGLEISRILETIEKCDLIVDMYNACMGFGLGITLASMPGYPGAEPVFVLSFNSDHLPCLTDTRKFDHAWGMLSPVCFSARNRRLHRFQWGKEPRQDKMHYDY